MSGDRLNGRVAFIAGGAQGIGKGIALAFAAEGCAVAVSDVNVDGAGLTAERLTERGVPALALEADVSDRAAIGRAVDRAADELGGVDILVTTAMPGAAADLGGTTTIEHMKLDVFDSFWRVGMMGVVHSMQACLPHFRAREYGRVINFSSAAGLMGMAGWSHYAPVKEAVRCLTKVVAHEWAPEGFTVNTICPFASSEAGLRWAEQHPEDAAAVYATVPLGGLADPELDVGRAAVFLASDDARHVTGATLMVDGGQCMAM